MEQPVEQNSEAKKPEPTLQEVERELQQYIFQLGRATYEYEVTRVGLMSQAMGLAARANEIREKIKAEVKKTIDSASTKAAE